MKLHSATPVLRIFDEAKAKDHYIGFFGFSVDWEHRFGEGCPIYLQISQGECRIHLSEHAGDGCPGANIRIEIEGLAKFVELLNSKKYKYSRPGIMEQPWGERSTTIADPFGNKVIFFEPIQKS